MTREDLVRAIREDSKIGRGTCSCIDECYSDDELWERFGEPAGKRTVRAGLAAARRVDKVFREREREAEGW